MFGLHVGHLYKYSGGWDYNIEGLVYRTMRIIFKGSVVCGLGTQYGFRGL